MGLFNAGSKITTLTWVREREGETDSENMRVSESDIK